MKYGFTGKTVYIDGRLARQIQALKDFGDVKKGDLGGWIQEEENLSQEGDCWVDQNAMVAQHARIAGSVIIEGFSVVTGYTILENDEHIKDNVIIDGHTFIEGRSD